MAITKEKKEELVARYGDWAENSRAMIITEYVGLTTTQLENLRRQAREVGGEFHIVKNTLSKLALEGKGYPLKEEFFTATTAIGFAFEDAPAMAKVINDLAKASDFVKIKGGYLGSDLMEAAQVSALAELPPLPVVRAGLIGTLLAPAGQLARLVKEPGRQLAQLVKAHAERESAAA